MNNREFSAEIEKRTLRFAVDIIRLSASLPDTPEARVVRNQINKSDTSVGANYREANRARSNADFKNKIKICESEASETCYWCEVITEAKLLRSIKIQPLVKECYELLAIFASIGKNMSSNSKLVTRN